MKRKIVKKKLPKNFSGRLTPKFSLVTSFSRKTTVAAIGQNQFLVGKSSDYYEQLNMVKLIFFILSHALRCDDSNELAGRKNDHQRYPQFWPLTNRSVMTVNVVWIEFSPLNVDRGLIQISWESNVIRRIEVSADDDDFLFCTNS